MQKQSTISSEIMKRMSGALTRAGSAVGSRVGDAAGDLAATGIKYMGRTAAKNPAAAGAMAGGVAGAAATGKDESYLKNIAGGALAGGIGGAAVSAGKAPFMAALNKVSSYRHERLIKKAKLVLVKQAMIEKRAINWCDLSSKTLNFATNAVGKLPAGAQNVVNQGARAVGSGIRAARPVVNKAITAAKPMVQQAGKVMANNPLATAATAGGLGMMAGANMSQQKKPTMLNNQPTGGIMNGIRKGVGGVAGGLAGSLAGGLAGGVPGAMVGGLAGGYMGS